MPRAFVGGKKDLVAAKSPPGATRMSRGDFLKAGGTGLVGASLLGATGCGIFGSEMDRRQEGGNTLRINLGAEITSLDPTEVYDTVSFDVIYNLNAGLYRVDVNLEPQPEMARSVDVSEDERTYTFTLRDGVRWSNGDPVTSQDFRYAWLRAMNPDTAGSYSSIFTDFIEGGAGFLNGDSGEDGVGVEAPDEKTLIVTLVNPTPFFLRLMGHQSYVPLNEDFVREQGEEFAQSAGSLLYNGPYELAEFDPAEGVVMVKNESYWNARSVQIGRVDARVIKDTATALNLYEAGELDITSLTSNQTDAFEDDPEFHTYVSPLSIWLSLNREDPAMANENIRRAIQSGIDKEPMVNEILNDGSEAAWGLVPSGIIGPGDRFFREAFEEPAAGFDPDRARQYYERGVEELGEEPTLTLLISDSSTIQDAGTYLQDQLEKNLGANVELEVAPFDARLDREEKGDFQFVLTGYGLDYNDPTNFLRVFDSDFYFNNIGFSSERYDRLLNDAQGETDPRARMELLAEAERVLLNEEAAIVPMYYGGISELRKPHLENVIRRGGGAATEIAEWRIERGT